MLATMDIVNYIQSTVWKIFVVQIVIGGRIYKNLSQNFLHKQLKQQKSLTWKTTTHATVYILKYFKRSELPDPKSLSLSAVEFLHQTLQ